MENATSVKSNLQVIKQAFVDFSKGNINGILEMCTDDVKWETYSVPGLPYTGSFYGKEGVGDFFSKLSESITYTHFEPTDFITEGDWIIVLGHEAGIINNTGKAFDNKWCFSNKMKDGKLQQYFAYVDSYLHSEAIRKSGVYL